MYLNCHTYYSLRFGTFSETDLLDLAQANALDAVALTDINNTSACLNFVRHAKKRKIKAIIGIDFRVGAQQNYVGLAKNNEGFKALNQFLSKHSEQKIKLPDIAPTFDNAFIIYPFEKVLQQNKNTFAKNEFVGVSINDLRKLRFSKIKQQQSKIVLLQPVTVRDKKDFNAHRLLRAIDNNTLLSKLEKTEECNPLDKMLSLDELNTALAEFPFIIENTKKLIKQCDINFGFGDERESQNQKLYTDSFENDCLLLEKLCDQGLPKRYALSLIHI